MYKGVYIPTPLIVIIVMGVSALLFYVIKFKTDKNHNRDNKWSKRFFTFANSFFVVIIISSLAYQNWQWEKYFSGTSIMKMSLALFGLLSIYLNVMYIRAEYVHKEKRGNQRIKDNPEESYKEVKKVAAKAKSGKSKEIVAFLGESRENEGYPVVLREKDFFVHTLICGSTGSGKTASVLEPLIYQLLVQKKLGKKLGVSIVEPKRDMALQAKEFCDEMDIPYIFIDPLSEDTHRFNPMEGETDQVAEATVIVLQSLFGQQDPFFESIQELSARNVTKLLKKLYGDNLDIIDVMNTLRDPNELQDRVNELEQRDGMTDLVHFFKAELLGESSKKYREFVIGLRSQLENITSNDLLRKIMTGKSDFSINEHFEKGGVLIVNTELGRLGKSGNIFGQFLIMHLQNGTFNRPIGERIPHFMIVDEYSLYINPEIERFLSVARSYRVAGIFATQSLGQLEIDSGKIKGKAMKQAIMTSCRNQMVFGGVSSEDAYQFAEEFGKDKVTMRQATYKHRIFMPVLFPESYRDTETEEYRFDPTDIMTELKKYTFIHKLMYDNQIQRPEIAKGNLVPDNWKKLREWEDRSISTRLKRTIKRFLAGIKRTFINVIDRLKEQRKESKPSKERVTQTTNITAITPTEKEYEQPNNTNAEEKYDDFYFERFDFDDEDELPFESFEEINGEDDTEHATESTIEDDENMFAAGEEKEGQTKDVPDGINDPDEPGSEIEEDKSSFDEVRKDEAEKEVCDDIEQDDKSEETSEKESKHSPAKPKKSSKAFDPYEEETTDVLEDLFS